MADSFGTPWPDAGLAGHIGLDFVNTVDWRLRKPPTELLHSYEDLLRWARSAGILSRGEARELREWGSSHPGLATSTLKRAIALREAIASLCRAGVKGKRLSRSAMIRLERAAKGAQEHRVLRPTAQRAEWKWHDDGPRPERPLHAVALATVDLLSSPEFENVRQCGDRDCGWFFLDTSRNRSRRWCSMESCGNRNKARRHYRREVARKNR